METMIWNKSTDTKRRQKQPSNTFSRSWGTIAMSGAKSISPSWSKPTIPSGKVISVDAHTDDIRGSVMSVVLVLINATFQPQTPSLTHPPQLTFHQSRE
jgi:hypothetical protein